MVKNSPTRKPYFKATVKSDFWWMEKNVPAGMSFSIALAPSLNLELFKELPRSPSWNKNCAYLWLLAINWGKITSYITSHCTDICKRYQKSAINVQLLKWKKRFKVLTTPGKQFSASIFGPSYWLCGDPPVELSELLSGLDGMFELTWHNLAVSNCQQIQSKCLVPEKRRYYYFPNGTWQYQMQGRRRK